MISSLSSAALSYNAEFDFAKEASDYLMNPSCKRLIHGAHCAPTIHGYPGMP